MDSNYYLDFENRFRGDRVKIINQFSVYDDLVELIIQHNQSSVFVDIGCGRGEWLERWKNRKVNCFGIESDANMIKTCKDLDLNVIEADALSALKGLKDSSVTLITIFHMIEHLESKILMELMVECKRVLSSNGVLIMETPSIDNLIVSSKLFYLDPTHVNHINPDGISYLLEKIGFDAVKYYYIHGGPLRNSEPLKITRILNGVAQDLLIVATKSKSFSKTIFSDNLTWHSCLDEGISTLKAAEEYDLNHQTLVQSKINNQNIIIEGLKDELSVLKRDLNFFIKILKKIKNLFNILINSLRFLKRIVLFLFRPFIKFLYLIKFFFIIICKKFIEFLFELRLIKKILFSKLAVRIISFLFDKGFSKLSILKNSRVIKKLDKISKNNHESNIFNEKLLSYYNSSLRAQDFSDFLQDQINKKNI